MPYCPNCGKEVKEEDVFCPNCQYPLKGRAPEYRRMEEKGEKREKAEKREKREKEVEKREKEEKGEAGGALIGGLVLIWLGVTFFLRSYGYIGWADWWAYFILGLGAILILNGLFMYSRMKNWPASSGFVIGGGILSLVGVANILNLRNWWAIIFVLGGAFIIVSVLMQRRRNPPP